MNRAIRSFHIVTYVATVSRWHISGRSMYGKHSRCWLGPDDFHVPLISYRVIIRYIPLQTRSTPITYRNVSGSRNRIKPAMLVSNIPPNRITGEPREIGAPALKVTYNPIVTPLKANPIPILAKIPESWACCGMPRVHCHSTQASPVEKVQQPYININRLLEILFAANFTHKSAAANAHAVIAAYLIQPIIQVCPPVVNAINYYRRSIKLRCTLLSMSTKAYPKASITSRSEVCNHL